MSREPSIGVKSDVVVRGAVEGEVESREEDRNDEIQFSPGETRCLGKEVS